MASPYASLKEEAWEANCEIPVRGLALYTWGNVSAFDPRAGVFAIKPSGVPYPDLKAEDMVVIDLEGKTVEGSLNPSSDTPTHLVLYREFTAHDGALVRGIIHTHSTHAVAWAQACMDIPLFGTTHADHIQVPVPCTPYLSKEAVERDYEKETGDLIVDHFRAGKLNPDEVSMVLVGGHGPFAWGASAAKAVYNGAVLEEVARMAYLTRQINPGAKPLPDYIVGKHYSRKHGPNAYYGQTCR
ncbi:L-ribulose-5-phosphate 4-epimerase AraD [Treponema zuelzerae]|uniref:L-ribulose-5-phosphate 4-epimerase n=1 Tax=Teretinema zuelzerae TaxID=156 RepID=A0AAE3EK94_9SPIR|nr:L-ribulose-5-phosphate 4-epimerase AraD [Teretinema zuelzerae]MCD1655875.1 L-ribulose-5-phosphate 4-epimerase AraD [Teretinema zuelzerae]